MRSAVLFPVAEGIHSTTRLLITNVEAVSVPIAGGIHSIPVAEDLPEQLFPSPLRGVFTASFVLIAAR